MDIKLLTPVQIFVNGKFFCTAERVEVKRNSAEFKKSLLPDNPKINPDDTTGTVVNIIRKPTTKKERDKIEAEKKKGAYDEFFNRMVEAKDDPEAHTPVDTSDL